jgi:ADP-heptose:LPS heptosyltransferase
MSVLGRLRQLYLRIGIHAAPPGTLLYFLHSRARALLHRHAHRYATGDVFARGRFGGIPYYDIARIRRSRPVDGLALIFFMGLGDYLFTTPVIEALRIAHPGLLLHAYVSTSMDAVNSPLVADLLRGNRYIDAVFTYRGKPRRYWIDYDFSDCLKNIPRNFIILPVIYGTGADVAHRVTALFETFGLPVALPVPPPILEPVEMSAAAAAVLAKIQQYARQNRPRAVVVCHFGTRSSNYLYPHAGELVARLAEAGFLVVNLSSPEQIHRGVIGVDLAEISPTDTIEILRASRQCGQELYTLSVNSVIWPLSAALGITNLGLHIFHDTAVHQYVYPNTFVITQHAYPRVSPARLFLATEEHYRERVSEPGVVFTDYDAAYVFDCFERLVNERTAISKKEMPAILVDRVGATGRAARCTRQAGAVLEQLDEA